MKYRIALDSTNLEKPYGLFEIKTGKEVARYAGEYDAYEAELLANKLAERRAPASRKDVSVQDWHIPYARDFDEPPCLSAYIIATPEALQDLWSEDPYDQK